MRKPAPPLDRFIQFLWPALACGCFDQARFVHDFRALSGMRPGAYAGA